VPGTRSVESPERESPHAIDRPRREDRRCSGDCEGTAVKSNGRDPDRPFDAVFIGDRDLIGV
jgi:hypothetical protein